MMDNVRVNEATGEVSVKIGTHTFTLKATFKNLADFQAALAVPGLQMMQFMLQGGDPRAMLYGLQCLCTSGNEKVLEDMLLMPHLDVCKEAIMKAITAGLPEVKPDEPGKAEGTTVPATVMN